MTGYQQPQPAPPGECPQSGRTPPHHARLRTEPLSRLLSATRERIDRARVLAGDHPRHVGLTALVAGLLSPTVPTGVLASAVAVLVSLCRTRTCSLLVAGLLLLGANIAERRVDAITAPVAPGVLDRILEGEATVLEAPRPRARGEAVVRVRWHAEPLGGRTLLVRLRAGATGVEPGARVYVRGRFGRLPEYEAHQKRRGAAGQIAADALRPTGRRRGGIAGGLDAARRRAEAGLQTGLSPGHGALLTGMVIGDDAAIDDATREAFERSGLAHLLAVSGQNVLLLALLTMLGAAAIGLDLRGRLIAALVLVALYVPLTGAGPSVQRAGVMGAAGLVAALAGRPSDRWYALGLAAAVTLALNPLSAQEPGWQLSFAAVIGLLALVAPMSASLVRRRAPRPLADIVAVTLAATLATMPLLAHHFEQVSIISPPANLAVAPAVAPIMWLGMVAAAVAQVSAPLAEPVVAAAEPLLRFVLAVAHVAAAVPGASPAVRLPSAAGVVAAYAVLVALVLVVRAAVRRARAGRGARVRRRLVASVAVAALGLLTVGTTARSGGVPPPGPDELVVSFLDIGQGHATLLRQGPATMLVDTGPDPALLRRRLEDEGVRRLDLLVLTHAQLDHDGGAADLLRRRVVMGVLDGGSGTRTPARAEIEREAAAAGVPRIVGRRGQVLRLGDAELRVLWPPDGLRVEDANDAAIVLLLSWRGFDLLLPADAEGHVTTRLPLPRVEAMQVAHHGSEDEKLPALLEQVRPALAVIGTGRGNRYGHPRPETLTALERTVPRVLRTDHDGTVRLRVRDGRMTVEAQR